MNFDDLLNIFSLNIDGFDISKVSINKEFKKSGIDSLDLMNIFLVIEENYNIKFTDFEISTLNTPEKLLEISNLKIINK